MTDPITSPLTLLGDSSGAVCEGEFCEIPEHHEQAIVNRRLDDDRV
ncbi:MAG: hypothetical protein JWR83_30 [Aeromicrobium sp.]|nr:hypothetical protein [Aeromicrobium sp.]